MTDPASLAPLPVAVPFVVAGFAAATRNVIPGRWLNALATLTAAFSTVLCALLLRASLSGPIVYWFGDWRPRGEMALGIAFTVDPFGAAFATLTGLLFVASLVFSSRYFDDIHGIFHVLMMAFLGAMSGFCLTGDLFNMFVFYELMSAAGIALCAYETEERGPVQGGLNFAITNTVGGFMVLSGIGLVYGRTGALNMAQAGLELDRHGADGLVVIAFLLILSGFLIKGGIVPFHFWVADAHAVAPAPVCALFSGVMFQLGLFGIFRIYWALFAGALGAWPEVLAIILMGLGGLSAVAGGLMCLAQRHIKRLLAFSTISHSGVVLIGFGMLERGAAAGTLIYVLSHAMFKGALFLCSGILLHRYSTVDEGELKGAGRRREAGLLVTGILFAICGLGLAGAPPFGLFLGKSMIDEHATHSGYEWAAYLAITSSVLTGAAILRVAGRVFLGWGSGARQTSREDSGHPVPVVMLLPAAALTGIGVALGALPWVGPVALAAAGLFAAHVPYLQNVFGAPAAPASVAPFEWPVSHLWRGVLAAGVSIAIAAISLRAKPQARFERAMRPLRRLHTGHPGDYVAWITFGAAALGVLFVTLFR